MRPTRAPPRVISAFVPVVVPWTSRSQRDNTSSSESPNFAAASAIASKKLRARSSGRVGTFPVRTLPSGPTIAQSVNVPPMSTPTACGVVSGTGQAEVVPRLVAAPAELLCKERGAGGAAVLAQDDLLVSELRGVGVQVRVDGRRRQLALSRGELEVRLEEAEPAAARGAHPAVGADV